MNKQSIDINHLHDLIDKYFDATATEAEERELRHALASTSMSSPKIDETRAVMGYFAIERSRERNAARHNHSWLRAAAAVALAIVCGAAIFTAVDQNASQDQCIAYIGDEEITDRQHVLAMMRSDLDILGEASQALSSDVNAQLSTLATELSF